MDERRKTPRGRTFFNGLIAYNAKNSTADCFVRNLTDAGAKVSVSATTALPDAFEFLIPGKREPRKARMIWRRGDEAGMAFEEQSATR